MTSSASTARDAKPSVSTTTQQKEIKELIRDLKQACFRPLFEEIISHDEQQEDARAQTTAENRKPKRIKRNPTKSWEQVRIV